MDPNADNVPVQSIDMPEAHKDALRSGHDNSSAQNTSEGTDSSKMVAGMTLPNLGPSVNPSSNATVALQFPQKPSQISGSDDDMTIEKEIVAKAKAAVQRTANDPYLQAKELGKIKAELLKRRYGKDLKLSEG